MTICSHLSVFETYGRVQGLKLGQKYIHKDGQTMESNLSVRKNIDRKSKPRIIQMCQDVGTYPNKGKFNSIDLPLIR